MLSGRLVDVNKGELLTMTEMHGQLAIGKGNGNLHQ